MKRSPFGLSRRSLIKGTALASIPGSRTFAQTPDATPMNNPLHQIPVLVEQASEELSLRSVLLTIHDHQGEVFSLAQGESESGTPASLDMHFRIGAVSITYMGVLLLNLADDGLIDIDEPISTWLPGFPESETATPRMLAQMTAGYPDYVHTDAFITEFYQDPFRTFTADERIGYSLDSPRLFQPGENWDYSHAGIVILGRVIELAAGKPLADLMAERILAPLGLRDTYTSDLPHMKAPVLHAYSSERRSYLGIDPDVRFYEDTSTWNPSWTLAPGSVQYSTLADIALAFRQIGQGAILSESAFRELTSESLRGFGAPMDGCLNCHTLDNNYTYAMGLVISNGWYVQNPMFAGCGATVATLPKAGSTIAVAVTFREGAFDGDGGNKYGNSSQTILRRVSEILVPGQPYTRG